LARRSRPRTRTITDLLAVLHPALDDPDAAIASGRVLVDGKPVLNPGARVAESATVTVEAPTELRGAAKLEAALAQFAVPVERRVALDCGAAAGGFTTVLLRRGARRVYAVDAGFGQLRGELRQDPRVVNLERTNLGDLTTALVPESIDVVTLDLSYVALSVAVPELDAIELASQADLVALVKPMFELALAGPPDSEERLTAAVGAARHGIENAGWQVLADMQSPVRGTRGAVEFFVHARR
jgi:23S rRNA (cytidine1920-2'-O)/16S rRNA (cytidine1409-2'-O)-methyltransferase